MTTQQSPSKLSPSKVLSILERAKLVLSHSQSSVVSSNPAGFSTDSRKIEAGGIFLAYAGVSSDGHAHLESVIAKGASLLIVEDSKRIPSHCETPWIEVRSGRFAWAYLAADSHGNPQNALRSLAITGTNGKTSTAWMVRSLLKASGKPCLLIGTLGAWVGDRFVKTNHTTPDPDLLYSLFAQARDEKIKFVVMEAASQSFIHGKLSPITFCAAAFTSFSRDHLDLHGSMEDYFEAKWSLFEKHLTPSARVAIYSDVPFKDRWERLTGKDLWSYGPQENAGMKLHSNRDVNFRTYIASSSAPSQTDIVISDGGVEKDSGSIPFAGDFFIDNFCAALLLAEFAVGHAINSELWKSLPPVPGRLESVQPSIKSSTAPHLFVDYAHTPDALEKALCAVRPLTKGNLIVVFGCGGDRDKGKRSVMGEVASRLADFAIITSDNPRSESPEQILRDIASGFSSTKFKLVADRKQAILDAVSIAKPGDLILGAGKGHEDYQIIGNTTLSFDDRIVAKEALDSLGKRIVE